MLIQDALATTERAKPRKPQDSGQSGLHKTLTESREESKALLDNCLVFSTALDPGTYTPHPPTPLPPSSPPQHRQMKCPHSQLWSWEPMTAKAFLLSEVSPGSDRLVYYSPLQRKLQGMNTGETKPVWLQWIERLREIRGKGKGCLTLPVRVEL